ncbi:GNAT family N-acetyltransferase [Nocardia sp. NPDC059239]|uniref:GNAT family N-acetyltransferase n=1 Tax=unclassified Nocardia TaxID=2637762 RepID=UPI0036A4951E
MIVCGRLAEAGLAAARRLAVEYLLGAEGVDRCWAWRPDLVVSALVRGQVVGVCFASPGSGTGIVVDGIAVDGDFAGRGIGSRLL